MGGVVKKAKPLIATAVGAYAGFVIGGPSGALRGAALGYSLGSAKKPSQPGGLGSSGSISTPDTGQSATAIGEAAWVPKQYGTRRSGMVLTATDLTNDSHQIVQDIGGFAYSVYTLGEGPWNKITQLHYQNIKIFKDAQTINFGQVYGFGDAIFNDDIDNLEIEFVQGNATQSLSTMLQRVTWGYTGTNFTSGDRWFEDTDVGNGICYMVVRVKRDKNALIRETAPSFTIESEGKQIPEIRLEGQTRQFSGSGYNTGTNPAMIALDQLRSDNFGLGLSNNEIDFDSFVNFANYCDNPGTYSDGTSIPAFTLNGQFNQGSSIKEILEEISLATGCLFADENGIVTVKLDKLEASTTTTQINEDNLIGNITRSEPRTSTTPNAINVTFLDANAIETTEVIEFSSSVIANEGRKEADVTLRMVQDAPHAREIAKRMLYHMRQPTYTFNVNNTGYGLDTYGISNIADIFETSGVPASGLNMSSSGDKIRIFSLSKARIQENANQAPVKVTAKLYTDQIYNVNPQGMTLQASAKTSDAPGLFNIPQPSNLTISTLSDTTAKLNWTNVYQYNTLIEFKTAGQPDSTYVEAKIVGNGPADITLPSAGTYDISIRFLIPNTSINTGPGPRNVFLNYISTGTAQNVRAENGLLVIDGQVDKSLEKYMHVRYANDANGEGIRSTVAAAQEIQEIDHAGTTSVPSTLEYDNTTATNQKVQLTFPNDFDAGVSTPEKQEFTYTPGTTGNQVNTTTTGVNEQLQLTIDTDVETGTDPGEQDVQKLAYLTASSSNASGTTYQLRFGSNNVGSSFVSTGPGDLSTVINNLKSRVDASVYNYTAVINDDGIGNGDLTITADADGKVNDNWNVVITTAGSLGFTHSIVNAGVNGGKPRTDEGSGTGNTTNQRTITSEQFAEVQIDKDFTSSNIFPKPNNLPTSTVSGSQGTTKHYFALKFDPSTYVRGSSTSYSGSSTVRFSIEDDTTDQAANTTNGDTFYFDFNSAGYSSGSISTFENALDRMTNWAPSSSGVTAALSDTEVDEDHGIFYFSLRNTSSSNGSLSFYWNQLNTVKSRKVRVYFWNSSTKYFYVWADLYWCHKDSSNKYLSSYKYDDGAGFQTGTSSSNNFELYAPQEFLNGTTGSDICTESFNINASSSGGTSNKTTGWGFADYIRGKIQADTKVSTAVLENSNDRIKITYNTSTNAPTGVSSNDDIRIKQDYFKSTTSSSYGTFTVNNANYQAAQDLGTNSSFQVTFPDGSTSTTGLTNFASQASLDTVGTAVASCINANADWSASYDSSSNKVTCIYKNSDPVSGNFIVNHTTSQTDGQAANDIGFTFSTVISAGTAVIQPTITFDPDINNTVYTNALTHTFSRNLDANGVAAEFATQIANLDSNITTSVSGNVIDVDFGTEANITASYTVTNAGTHDGVNFTTSDIVSSATDGVTQVQEGQLSNMTVTSPEGHSFTIIPLNNADSTVAAFNTDIVNQINSISNFSTLWTATNDTGNNKLVITRNNQTASTGTYNILINNKPNAAGDDPNTGSATISNLSYGTDINSTTFLDEFNATTTNKVDAKTFSFAVSNPTILDQNTFTSLTTTAYSNNADRDQAVTDIENAYLNAQTSAVQSLFSKTLISGNPANSGDTLVYEFDFGIADNINAAFTFNAGTTGSSSNISESSSTTGLLGTLSGGGTITSSDVLTTDVVYRDPDNNVLLTRSYNNFSPLPNGWTNYTMSDLLTLIDTNKPTGWSYGTSSDTITLTSTGTASITGTFQLNITNNGTVPSGQTIWSTTPSNGTFTITQEGGALAQFYGIRATSGNSGADILADTAANASNYIWKSVNNTGGLTNLFPSYKIVSGRIVDFNFVNNPILSGYNAVPVNNIIDTDTATTTVIENLPVNAPASTPLNGSEMLFVDGSFYIAMRLSTNSTTSGTVINFVPVSGTVVYNDFTSSVTLTDQGYGTPTLVSNGVYQYDGAQGWTKLN